MPIVHGGAASSLDLGFGCILGKLGEVVLELLPTPEPRLNDPHIPLGDIGVFSWYLLLGKFCI